MNYFSILVLAVVCLLVSCESTSYAPPPVTEKMAKASAKKHVRHGTNLSDWRIDPSTGTSLATLRKGRVLFVHRCIECHTLPAFWHYRASDWPEIVDSMSHRASLKPAERDAIVAYILAARANELIQL